MKNALEIAKQLIADGNEEKARSIIVSGRNKSFNDPEIHFQWGLLCEEIASFRLARQSYEEALRLSPRNARYLYRLGLLHSEAGKYEKAVRFLTQAINQDPQNTEVRKILAELYTAMGYRGAARLINEDQKEEPPHLRYFPPSISKADTDLFLRLFSGRETGWATQEIKGAAAQSCWSYQDCILDPDMVTKHILGEKTLGGLPLRSDKTIKYAAINIKPHQHAVFHYLKNPSILSQIEEATQEYARKIVLTCSNIGIPAYIENPGDHGRRIWFFFSRFFHFLLIKRLLNRIMELAPIANSHIAVDKILATQPVGIGWQECIVMLPLGINRQTEKRCLFLDIEGTPFKEQLKHIRKIREIDETQVKMALKKPLVRTAQGSKSAKLNDASKPLWKCCPVLAELKNKAQSGRKLTSDEKLILFYTLGVSLKLKPYIHDILEPCPDYHYQKVERILSQLKPHPISCLKIRKLIPDITSSVNCSCIFNLQGGRYPSPFLHIDPDTPLCISEENIAGISIKDLACRYLTLLANLKEIKKDLARLETVLVKQMTKKGIDSVHTSSGTLRKIIEGEKVIIGRENEDGYRLSC